MVSRRNFLVSGMSSMLALGFPATLLAALNTRAEGQVARANEALPCLVYNEGQSLGQLDLVAVERPSAVDSRIEQYVLQFTTQQPIALQEATYEVRHPQMGSMHLFLQPCGEFPGGRHDGRAYHACMALLK